MVRREDATSNVVESGEPSSGICVKNCSVAKSETERYAHLSQKGGKRGGFEMNICTFVAHCRGENEKSPKHRLLGAFLCRRKESM